MAETAKAASTSVHEASGEESYIAKLTVKTLGCKPDMVKTLEGQDKLALCRIFGKAAGVGYQDDSRNPGSIFTYFKGTFEGINMQTGETYRSGKLYLPKGISELVEAVIKNAEKNGKEQVSFAFEIRSVKATNPIGYSYEAVAIKRPEQEDELAELRKLLMAAPTLEQKKLTAAKK